MRSVTHPPTVHSLQTRLATCGALLTLGLVGFGAGRCAAALLAPPAAAMAAEHVATAVDAANALGTATSTDTSATALAGEASPRGAAPNERQRSAIDVERVIAQLAARPGPAYRRYLVELLTRQALA